MQLSDDLYYALGNVFQLRIAILSLSYPGFFPI
jgi:hypothetical protein